MENFLYWPDLCEWQSFRGNWPKIALAVRAINGTSHEIHRPVNNQEQFYSRHRYYHCIHTQIVVDNIGRIRHTEGFLGHKNDAQQFRLMQEIGIGGQLPFPDNCALLADKIYPNRHPVISPFSGA